MTDSFYRRFGRAAKRVNPLVWVGIGCALLGLVAGLLIGTALPGGSIPAPVQVTVVPQAGAADTKVVMPDVRGLTEQQARQALADHGISGGLVTVDQTPHLANAGIVVAQDPVAGTTAPTKVVLSLPVKPTMPNLVGKPETEARTTLQEQGAEVTLTREYDPTATVGAVIRSTPGAGEPLTEISTLVIAAPAATVALGEIESSGWCSSGEATINGTMHSASVTCTAYTESRHTVWLLNRKVARLTAVVGLDDHSDPNATVRVTVTGDGKRLWRETVAYGTGRPLEVGLKGVLRVVVTVQRTDRSQADSAEVALGEAQLLGAQADLDGLER